jgi:hypothetical protein
VIRQEAVEQGLPVELMPPSPWPEGDPETLLAEGLTAGREALPRGGDEGGSHLGYAVASHKWMINFIYA